MRTEPVTFTVADMSCSHCVGTITKALAEALPDAAVDIDLPRHLVRVSGDAAKAADAIREAGYTPQPA